MIREKDRILECSLHLQSLDHESRATLGWTFRCQLEPQRFLPTQPPETPEPTGSTDPGPDVTVTGIVLPPETLAVVRGAGFTTPLSEVVAGSTTVIPRPHPLEKPHESLPGSLNERHWVPRLRFLR